MKFHFINTAYFKRKRLCKDLGKDTSHGYSILHSSKTLRNYEYLYKVAFSCDQFGYISQALGEELDGLFMDTNSSVALHQTGYAKVNSHYLEDVFGKGLLNEGSMLQGLVKPYLSLETTATIYDDLGPLLLNLKTTEEEKNSQGAIILKIPKSCLGKGKQSPTPLYYYDYQQQGGYRILPQFIYGYIPVNHRASFGIIHNPNYQASPDLENIHLYYDEAAVTKEQLKAINHQQERYDLAFQYSVLEKAITTNYWQQGQEVTIEALKELYNSHCVTGFSSDNSQKALQKYINYGDITNILTTGLEERITVPLDFQQTVSKILSKKYPSLDK